MESLEKMSKEKDEKCQIESLEKRSEERDLKLQIELEEIKNLYSSMISFKLK
jgi:hypothetical protein